MVEVINQFYRKQNYIRKNPESNILLPQFQYPTDSKKQQEYFEGNQLIDQHDTYYDAQNYKRKSQLPEILQEIYKNKNGTYVKKKTISQSNSTEQ